MRGPLNVRAVALYMLLLRAALGVIGACTALPSLEARTASTTLLETGDIRLGKAISPLVVVHPGVSGIYPLPDARDAFAARALLARAAERTLDVRYYIWRNDISGTLLFEALLAAADRGVRVRLLLDDEYFGAGKECEGCDQEFFPAGHVKSNFLCNLGYGDPSKLLPRSPRLQFKEACTLM